jgi:hypothetical protein
MNRKVYRCYQCKKQIIFDPRFKSLEGKPQPIDLDGKRHFCNEEARWQYEQNAIDTIKKNAESWNSKFRYYQIEVKITTIYQ